MSGYPVMLNLGEKTCVIVGAGRVAARKAADLLHAGARVVVISPQVTPAFEPLIAHENVLWDQQYYAPGMLAAYHPLLVFAATSSPQVNQQVAADARAVGALVNIVDQPDGADFASMAAIHRPPLTIAFSTGGSSPALARHLKQQIEQALGDEYAVLAQWLGELRPRILERVQPAQRQQLYEAILASDVLSMVSQQQTEAAHQRLHQLVEAWEMNQ